MRRCVIFSRVSSVYQSAEEQTKELYAEAYRNGYSDQDILPIQWTESAIKLDEAERMSIQKLYDAIDTYPIECVICRELSRIARRPDVLFRVRDKLIQSHVQLIICSPYMKLLDEKGKLSQTANMIFSIFGSLAESEMDIKRERFREGKLRKKNAGKWAGGFLPFGYDFDKDTHDIYVVPEQRDTIIKIFDLYVNKGLSTVKIAKLINQTGELSACRNGHTVETAVSTIGKILKNSAYIGEHPLYRGKLVDNVYPAIVSRELFEAAGQRLDKHNSRKNAHVEVVGKHIYFCSNILFDRNGNKLIGKSVANSYRFVRHDMSGENYQITVPINLVDSIVWHYVKGYIEQHDPLSNDTLIKNLEEERETLLRIIDNNRNRIKEIEDSIIRTNERIVTQKMTERTGEALLRRFEAEKEELDMTFITKMIETRAIEERIKGLKEAKDAPLDSASDEFKSEMVHKFVEKIVVEPTENWGEYELSIIYFDMNMDFATIKSMSKKAYNAIGDEICFDYLERFVRPKVY